MCSGAEHFLDRALPPPSLPPGPLPGSGDRAQRDFGQESPDPGIPGLLAGSLEVNCHRMVLIYQAKSTTTHMICECQTRRFTPKTVIPS